MGWRKDLWYVMRARVWRADHRRSESNSSNLPPLTHYSSHINEAGGYKLGKNFDLAIESGKVNDRFLDDEREANMATKAYANMMAKREAAESDCTSGTKSYDITVNTMSWTNGYFQMLRAPVCALSILRRSQCRMVCLGSSRLASAQGV